LLDEGRAWLKLSGPYLDSQVGAEGGYEDMDVVARAWVKAAPDRLVWGSDWPHPAAGDPPPDDAFLFDLLSRWTDDESVRQRILVDNPATLYGFPSR
jgi:D-galactarolactone isomerase